MLRFDDCCDGKEVLSDPLDCLSTESWCDKLEIFLC